MGQTLTHGVYLPDEGERNCYSGLAANWQILDSSVGTIAANTSALSGKAPLVHTHTKSDITDFPAYGNAAGTICEGNDSRLSDARTPVAHTHGKSDVTDLFNSANTWSNINTYQREICIAGDRNAYICPMWAGAASGIAFLAMDATKQFVFGQRTTDANNRSCYDATKGYLVIRTGETGGGNYVDVIPIGTDTRLGDSTNKWKTLNGINPGALSLPDMSATGVDISSYIQYPTGETSLNLSGGSNRYTASENGWLVVVKAVAACRYIKTVINSRLGAVTVPTASMSGSVYHCQPVPAGQTVSIVLDCNSAPGLYFYPCLGNV